MNSRHKTRRSARLPPLASADRLLSFPALLLWRAICQILVFAKDAPKKVKTLSNHCLLLSLILAGVRFFLHLSGRIVMALKRLTLSYLLDPEFEFWIFGRWNGKGIVQVRYAGNFVEELRLPRVRWAVLTTLAQRANACQAGPPERAFMTAREILDRLRNRKVLQTSNPGRVVRLIHELRKKLNKAKARKLQKAWGPGPREWGKRVIETHPLGYRLSLNPDNIHIQILDDGSAVPAPKSASFTRSIDSRRPWSAFTGPPRQ